MERRELVILAIASLLMQGCPADSDPEPEPLDAASPDAAIAADSGSKDAGAPADAGGSNPSAKVGTVTIRLVAPKPATGTSGASVGYTSIGGSIYDGPVPEPIIWTAALEQSGCKLMKPRVPFCDPACGGGSVCVEDDKCQSEANAKSVGVLTIGGLKVGSAVADVNVEPVCASMPPACERASYSTPGDVTLAYPGLAEGDTIRMRAPGAEVPGFDVSAKGIAPLEVTTQSFPLKAGQAFPLAWKQPGQAALARIEVKLDIAHHGGLNGKILCDWEDNGSHDIPAALVDELLKLGVAGFPTVTVARVNSATASRAQGGVELKLIADLEFGVTIDGLKSCTDSSECPTGQMCQADLRCK